MNKRTLTTILAALMATTLVFAQAAGPRGGAGQAGPGGKGQVGGGVRRMGQFQQKVLDQLNLNANQKSQIKALNDKRMAEMKARRDKMQANGQQVDREKMRAEMKKNQDAYQASLKKILTAQQFAKYEQLMKAEMEKMRKQGGGQPGAGGKAGKGGGGR